MAGTIAPSTGGASSQQQQTQTEPGTGQSIASSELSNSDSSEEEATNSSGEESESGSDELGTDESTSVVGHGGKEIPPEAISKRVDRGRRQLLRELFGTDDIVKAKQLAAVAKSKSSLNNEQMREYERLRRAEEARKRARLTEDQRRAKDLEERNQKIAELEAQIQATKESEVIRSQDQIIAEAASQYIDPKFLRFAKQDFRAALLEMKEQSPEKFAKFGVQQINKWFEKYASDNEVFQRKQESDQQSQGSVVKKPIRRVVTTTSKSQRTPPQSVPDGPGVFRGKTVRPGPNAMSNRELREYAKAQGIKLGF